MSPGVSVCIPAYESAPKLKRALDSVVMQTCPVFETIVTDDSKSDAVYNLVKEYENRLPIQYHRNKPSLGVPHNWNHAIELAKHDVIKVLHHDDWFTQPHSLETYAKALTEHPDVDFAFSATSVVGTSGSEIRAHRPTTKQLDALRHCPLSLFHGNYVGAPSATVFRKRPNLLFDPTLVWDVDWEFYIHCLHTSASRQFVYIDEVLIATETGDDESMTQACLKNPSLRIRERIHVYQKHAQQLPNSSEYLKALSVLATELGIVRFDQLVELGASPQLAEYIKRRGRLNVLLKHGRNIRNRLMRMLSLHHD